MTVTVKITFETIAEAAAALAAICGSAGSPAAVSVDPAPSSPASAAPEQTETETETETDAEPVKKQGRGRPKGSKNKKPKPETPAPQTDVEPEPKPDDVPGVTVDDLKEVAGPLLQLNKPEIRQAMLSIAKEYKADRITNINPVHFGAVMDKLRKLADEHGAAEVV